MDAVLVEEQLIDPEQLRELSERRNGPSARRLAAQLGLYLATGAALVLATHPAMIAATLIANGVVQFGLFGMLHEASHKTAFTRSGLNTFAGWIAALAQPMAPALMRAFHFAHHRHTHQLEGDSELAGLSFMAAWPRGLMWLATMSGVSVLVARAGWALFSALVPPRFDRAWTAVLPFVRPERRRRIAWESRALVLIHAGVMTAAVLASPALWRIYWGMVLGHMFLAWYITCEHRGLSEDGTILERTRTLEVPGLVRWLVWNMPYHAEHHGWPAVPWHALPRLHAEVRPQLVHIERPLYLHLHGGRERPRDLG